MSNIVTDPKRIGEILERGVVAEILPSKEDFKKLLASGRRLKIYLGIDPTFISLHLGHGENIMLLEDFRSLGHEAIVVVGNFTARVGDPSGRPDARQTLSDVEIERNVKGIVGQIRSILNFEDKSNPARLAYNADWLDKLNFKDLLEIASNFTVQQMIERDMFKKRVRGERPIFLNEFLYPLMQGYDSVELEVDAELGGTDQTFNMLAGRTLLKRMKDKEKFVVTVNLLANPKTGELMSKSRGTGVFLDSSASDMFGQIMAQPDEMVRPLLVTNTRLPLKEVERLSKDAEGGSDTARDAKLKTAEEIVALYHSKDVAVKAREGFIKTFSKGGLPEDIDTVKFHRGSMSVLDIVSGSGLVESSSEAKRLIEGNAVKIDNEVKSDGSEVINIKKPMVLRVGKKRFMRFDS